jgi:hypothetical protein
MKIISLFSALLFCFLFTSCGPEFRNDNCVACRGLGCTRIFVTLGIHVQDKNGNDVELADYSVKKKFSGKEIDLSGNEDWGARGYHIIATDAHIDEISCRGTKLIFTYSIDGTNYLEKEYSVEKDCCHVMWKGSEPEVIIID